MSWKTKPGLNWTRLTREIITELIVDLEKQKSQVVIMEVAGNDLANTTRSPDQVANLYIDQAIILVKNFGVMECRKVIICAALYQAQVSGMGNKLYNNRIDEFNGYLER